MCYRHDRRTLIAPLTAIWYAPTATKLGSEKHGLL